MSSEQKNKRVIVHIKQANEVAGFVSKKGKSTSDCFALNPFWNQWFCFNLQEDGENKVKIELFHYAYFGENKALGYAQATLDDIDTPQDLTLTLDSSETEGEITTTGTVECRLIPVPEGEDPLSAFERCTSTTASPVTATLCATATPGIEGASTSTSTASGDAPEEPGKPWDKKKKAKTLNITLPPSSPTSASLSGGGGYGGLAESPRSLSESGNLGSPGFKRSASSFFRRAATTPRGEAPSISALALSYTCQKAPPLQPKEKRTAGGLTKKSLESLSLPRRSKRGAQAAPKRRAQAARAPEKDPFAGSNGGRPLVECFFVVTAGDLAGDVEERLEEIRRDDPEAPSRLVIDPLVVAYSGTVAEVCPDRGWDTLAPSVWMFCAPEGLFLARGPRAPEVFPFVMTAENGERRYVTCLKHYVPLPHADAAALYDRCGRDGAADAGAQPLYAPRIYCVSATVPCYTFCREWLCRVHALGAGLGRGFSLEAAVAYLLGVPAPLVGGTALRATLDGRPMCEVRLPPQEDYPQYLDVPLRLLFRMLSVKNILLIFHSLLVEEKVLLVSRAKTVLTYAEEALTALMWPLRWSCIQISILPHQLSDFMSGPIVYLIGIPRNGANAGDAREPLPDDALVVDLDRDTATPPKSSAAAAAAARDALPPLPEDSCNALLADLKEYTLQDAATLDECGWRPWGDSEVSDADFNLGVRAAFLRFIVGLVRGYRESCRYIRVFPKPQMAIDEDLFARSAGKKKHPFYKAFSRSQALVGFLEAHKWPRENLFDTILEASTAGEQWAQSAHGIRDYLRSINDSSAPAECITAALKSTLPEKEAAEKRKIEEEEREDGDGDGDGRGPQRKVLVDVDAVRTMRLPPYVTMPEDERARRKEKKRREKEKEKEKEKADSLGEGKPFIPHTNEIEFDDTADPAEGLDLYITIADAIIDGKAGSINEEVQAELLHRLDTRAGRTIFSESLLSLNGDEVRKGREIQLPTESCQMLGTLLRHGLDKAFSEDDIISPQLLFQVGSTFYEAGKGDLVLLLLKGAKIWNEQRFWETLFYRKAHEECAKLYPPSIFEEMTKWDEKSDEEKEEIAGTEMHAIWKLLSDFCK